MNLATEIQECIARNRPEYGFRQGQRAFNELMIRRSDLADEIRDTRYDPYYEDTRLGLFYEWLEGRTETEAKLEAEFFLRSAGIDTEKAEKLEAIRRRVIDGEPAPTSLEYFNETITWAGKKVPARISRVKVRSRWAKKRDRIIEGDLPERGQ